MKLYKYISYEFIRKRTAKIYANYDQISRVLSFNLDEFLMHSRGVLAIGVAARCRRRNDGC